MKLYGGSNGKKQPPQKPDDFEIDWEKARRKYGDIIPKGYCEQEPAPQATRMKPTPPASPKQSKKTSEKSHNKKKFSFKGILLTLLFFVGMYNIAVFSNIPFIAKWRTIYIETAMDTMTHRWLATAFIPPFVIEKAMLGRWQMENGQDGIFSDWGTGSVSGIELKPWSKAQKRFGKDYPEIDQKSFETFMASPDFENYITDDGYLVIDEAGLNDDGTSIKTTAGDKVLALDTRNGIIITEVRGEGYVGKLALVKNPGMVKIGLAPEFGKVGAVMSKIAQHNNAVLAINSNGFEDPSGKGNGGHPYGFVRSDGETYSKAVGGKYKVVAFDKNNLLNIGNYEKTNKFRDGAEFRPALIINGKTLVEGSAGWGIQPRTAIGQSKSGVVLMLVIDGRAPGYSIGATLGECASIMERYNAVQACNLDGGSSSIMIYNGREITHPSAANKELGRRLPCGFIVK